MNIPTTKITARIRTITWVNDPPCVLGQGKYDLFVIPSERFVATRGISVWFASLILHNRRKRLRIKRCPADQCAIDFLLRHERRNVLWFHRSAVENAQACGKLVAKNFSSLAPDHGVRLGGSSGVAVLPVPIAHTGS